MAVLSSLSLFVIHVDSSVCLLIFTLRILIYRPPPQPLRFNIILFFVLMSRVESGSGFA